LNEEKYKEMNFFEFSKISLIFFQILETKKNHSIKFFRFFSLKNQGKNSSVIYKSEIEKFWKIPVSYPLTDSDLEIKILDPSLP